MVDSKWMAGNELKYLVDVLRNDKTQVPYTDRLEKAFAELYGLKYAIAMNSATSCIHAALWAAGIGEGDEVITPGYTVIMDSTPVIMLGATPVFADVDYATHNIDPRSVESKVTKRTKAIIAVSYHGLPYDIAAIKEIANTYGLFLLEDNAQTQLAYYKGTPLGRDADMALWSFERTKHLSTFEGGMLCTNNEDLAIAARKFAGLGFKNLTAGKSKMVAITPKDFQRPDYTRHDSLGLNYRYNEFCAAVALAQLERLDEIVALRQRIALEYDDIFAGTPFEPQTVPSGYTHSYFSYCVKSPYRETKDWLDFYNRHREKGGDDFYGMMQPPYKEPILQDLGYEGYCPVTEEIQRRSMLFKTNYRTLDEAKTYIEILGRTVHESI